MLRSVRHRRSPTGAAGSPQPLRAGGGRRNRTSRPAPPPAFEAGCRPCSGTLLPGCRRTLAAPPARDPDGARPVRCPTGRSAHLTVGLHSPRPWRGGPPLKLGSATGRAAGDGTVRRAQPAPVAPSQPGTARDRHAARSGSGSPYAGWCAGSQTATDADAEPTGASPHAAGATLKGWPVCSATTRCGGGRLKCRPPRSRRPSTAAARTVAVLRAATRRARRSGGRPQGPCAAVCAPSLRAPCPAGVAPALI